MQHDFEKQIGDKAWSVTQFGTTEGGKILTKLVALLGPAISQLADIAKGTDPSKSVLDQDINTDAIARAIQTLSSQIDENDFDTLVKRLLAKVHVGGVEVVKQYDVVFMGDYGTLFKVLAFVIQVNYGNFFAAASGVKNDLQAIAGKG